MEKPLVIVCTTAYRPLVGGAEIAIEETAKRLAPVFDFVIVTARMSRSLPRRETGPEGTIIRLGWGATFDKWLLPILAFLLVPSHIPRRRRGRRIVLWGVDISQGSLAACAIGLRFPKIPFVFTLQYGEGAQRLASGRLGFVGRAFRIMLLRADAVTAISSYLADAPRLYGFVAPVNIVPNGVDMHLFRLQGAKARGHRIVTVSRLVPKNGIDILIRAVAEAKKEIPDVQCTIIGEGPERENLETLGNAFVEALAAGLPAIGTRVGGIPDVIEDGKTGFLVPPEDPHSAAQKILELLRDPVRGDALARLAQATLAHFNWDGIADNYAELFSRELKEQTRMTLATGLFPPDIGGPATYSKILADELRVRGVGVKIAYFGAVRHLSRVIRHAAYFVRTLFMAYGSDIIFAQDPVSVGLPALGVAYSLRKKFVLKVVGDYAWEQYVQRETRDKRPRTRTSSVRGRQATWVMLEEFQSGRFDFLTEMRRRIQKFVACRADRVIVPSKYLAQIVAGWGVAPEKIKVIYNACEIPRALPSREDARASLGLSGTVIISAGRLVPWKGFSVLIDAVADMKEEIPDVSLVIAGSGPEENNIRQKIASRGIAPRVRLAGAISRETLLSYFAAGDVFVLNSGYEGLSHTLLEAVAVGLPVIASRIGGNPEVLTDDTRGTLIEYNNLEQLKAAIRETVVKTRPTAPIEDWPYTKERMIKATADVLKRV
ncbi:MAG: glycosyltransferase family 4 protein [Candidatus Sungbacteria bacterium]|nr:glycosyltransferase family 4 protein [Candidatus Sungbacteria bacterium]